MLCQGAKNRILDLILVGEEVRLTAKEAKSLKNECSEVGKRVERLSQLLKKLLCFISSAQTSLYLRPVNCILNDVGNCFKFALEIVLKCNRRNLFRRLFTCCNATHFRQLFYLLDSSITHMVWLVTVYDPRDRAIDPMVMRSAKLLVWTCIATVQMGRHLKDRVQAAKCIGLLAKENDEYKNIIFEEGGVPPLLKLLKHNSLDEQITAANTLCLLADEQEKENIIMKEMVCIIVNRLSRTSPPRDQIQAADLVASIVKHNPEVKEYSLIRENVIWRLVTLLSSEPSADDNLCKLLKLKISCSNALWELASGSVSNCKTLTETKGMLCLAKLVEKEKDKLQYNCLMIIKEITSVAESNQDFRHSAFKFTSKAAKIVVDQLLKVIKEFDDSKLNIPAIKSIGSLARSFSAKDSRVISSLVSHISNADTEVALEAAMALQKFICSDNAKKLEHSQSVIEFNGVLSIMKLLNGDIELQRHGLDLICSLVEHGDSSKALIKAGVLTALEKTGGLVAAEHPELEKRVLKAIFILQLNQTDALEESYSTSEDKIEEVIMEQSESDSSMEGRIEQAIMEQKYEACTSPLPIWKISPEKLVENVKSNYRSPSPAKRRRNRCLPDLLSLNTRRILPPLKAKCLDLALECPGRWPKMEAVMLKLLNYIVKSIKKKEIRRKFGYIIHKIRQNVVGTFGSLLVINYYHVKKSGIFYQYVYFYLF